MGRANEGYWPVLWFFGKVLAFIFMFIWLRGSLPRLRYDQFMAFGWKVLIPIALAWTVAVAAMRLLAPEDGGFDRRTVIFLAIGLGVVALLLLLVPEKRTTEDVVDPTAGRPGGFPVPPMPTSGAVRGAAEPLVFPTELEERHG